MPDEEQEQDDSWFGSDSNSDTETETDSDSDTDTDADNQDDDSTSDSDSGGTDDNRSMFDMFVDAGTFVATGGLIDNNPEEGQTSKSSNEDDS
jgi:serine-aspartate repeat-containing protein C/D/E